MKAASRLARNLDTDTSTPTLRLSEQSTPSSAASPASLHGQQVERAERRPGLTPPDQPARRAPIAEPTEQPQREDQVRNMQRRIALLEGILQQHGLSVPTDEERSSTDREAPDETRSVSADDRAGGRNGREGSHVPVSANALRDARADSPSRGLPPSSLSSSMSPGAFSLKCSPLVHSLMMIEHYIPDHPWLRQVVAYTTLYYMSEFADVDYAEIMRSKMQAIKMLNAELQSDSSGSDAIIVGLLQVVANEWYWGAMEDLRAHLNGLYVIVQNRGGLSKLGMNGRLAQEVQIQTMSISIAHEHGFFQTDPGEDSCHRTRPAVSPTPLVSYATGGITNPLGLDDMSLSTLEQILSLQAEIASLPTESGRESPPHIRSRAEDILRQTVYRLQEDGLRAPADALGPSQTGPRGGPSGSEGWKDEWSWPSKATEETPSGESATRDDRPAATILAWRPETIGRLVRMVSRIYAQAILSRLPLSIVCTTSEFQLLDEAVRSVPLLLWMAAPRWLLPWLLLPLVTKCHGTEHKHFYRRMFLWATQVFALLDWNEANEFLKRVVLFQAWLPARA